jgi:hypothetical protein
MIVGKYRIHEPQNQSPIASVDELLDRLRLADRRGRLDEVRQIEAMLGRRGQEIKTFELAGSSREAGR